MKLLLDTHIWLWSVLEPDRLGRRTSTTLRDRETEIWLSPISVWEAMLLAERGRIDLEPDPERWIRGILSRLPLEDARLTREVALLSRTLEATHQDPADRFLAATAIVHGLTLATEDRNLRQIPNLETLSG